MSSRRAARAIAGSARLWRRALRRRLGLMRSIAIYNLKPRNRARLRRFYRPFIQPDALCFDIGAHVGNRTRAWLELGARVVSVEPQPICARFLRRQFGHRPGWHLCPRAIAERPGTATLVSPSLNPAVSSLSPSWRRDIAALDRIALAWDEAVNVQVTTLDQLIDTYGLPAFCKLDVEDYELPALRGLSRPVPALSYEFYPTTMDKAVACLDRLQELADYRYNWSMVETLRMRSPRWLTAAEMRATLASYTGRRSGDVYARLAE